MSFLEPENQVSATPGQAEGYAPPAAAALLSRALDQPAGPQTVLGALAVLDFTRYREPQQKKLFRAAESAGLAVGEWQFEASSRAEDVVLNVVHVVHGVALQTTTLSPGQAGARLAEVLFDSAAQAGSYAMQQLQSVLYGLERATA